nr:hypothetical protein [Tanacetum cinerariifolium]
MVKSNREVIKKEKQLKKGKAKLVEPEVDDEEMLQLQKQIEEEEAFYNGLKKKGTTSKELKKLSDVGISSFNDLMNYAKKNPKISGLTEARLYEICKAAMKAGKVSGINLLLKQTAFAKKRNFVFVKNLPKDFTTAMLLKKFELFRAQDAEIRKGKKYGFVYFKGKDDARRALSMNGMVINCQMISVQMGVNKFAEGSSSSKDGSGKGR